MGPVLTTGYLLTHTATIIMRQSDQVLQERLGIGMSQFRLLLILQKTPHVQQRTLAERLGQTEASVSRQIKLLCEKGLLAIRVNPKSRREHITIPTAKGVKITEAAMDVLTQYHAPMFDTLTDKQRQLLNEALATLHEYTCAPGRPFACDHSFSTVTT
ncbi:MAG TPA: MarR family winged helix-turn-helix transcriptional regulator [Candidatus Saccharimonadales bacterium]|nr:MarR family winged helix-turn-helix transcriptional regulator [Candidatus Saccharimonadales bacterium]